MQVWSIGANVVGLVTAFHDLSVYWYMLLPIVNLRCHLIDIYILLLAIHLFIFTVTDKLLVTDLCDVLFYILFFDSAFSSDYIMLNDWMISVSN